jgi:hypothetical protein
VGSELCIRDWVGAEAAAAVDAMLAQARQQAEEILAEARERGASEGAQVTAATLARARRRARGLLLAGQRQAYEALGQRSRDAVPPCETARTTRCCASGWSGSRGSWRARARPSSRPLTAAWWPRPPAGGSTALWARWPTERSTRWERRWKGCGRHDRAGPGGPGERPAGPGRRTGRDRHARRGRARSAAAARRGRRHPRRPGHRAGLRIHRRARPRHDSGLSGRTAVRAARPPPARWGVRRAAPPARRRWPLAHP